MTDARFTHLQDSTLRLRRFCASDAEAFAAYRSDQGVARYQGWEPPYPLERAQRFVTEMATAPEDVPGEWLQIAVALTRSDELVGDCAFAPLVHEPRTVEIGFTIAPEHQGRGYAREAASLLLRHVFADLGKHRVVASCDPRNVPSARVLEAVGMRREGLAVESTWAKGEWADDLRFAILRREWAT